MTTAQLSMFAPPVIAPPAIVERERASPELTREAIAATHRLDCSARCELREIVSGQRRGKRDAEGLADLGMLERDGSASPLAHEVVRLLGLPTGERQELGIPSVRLPMQGGGVIPLIAAPRLVLTNPVTEGTHAP